MSGWWAAIPALSVVAYFVGAKIIDAYRRAEMRRFQRWMSRP